MRKPDLDHKPVPAQFSSREEWYEWIRLDMIDEWEATLPAGGSAYFIACE